MKKALLAVAVMSLASAASADLEIQILNNPDPAAGLKSFTVYFLGVTSGDYLAAVDLRFDGTMHQVWSSTYVHTPFGEDLSVGDPDDPRVALDTHLVFPSAQGVVPGSTEPDEDGTVGENKTFDGMWMYNGREGFGSWFANTADTNMALGIDINFQVSNFAFAQIVYAVGSEIALTGKAVGNNMQELELDMVIPEPATLGLVLLGGVAALARRRR